VKNFARLVLFIFIFFALTLALSIALSFLQLWDAAAAAVPARRYISFEEAADTVRWALSLTLYATALVSISYAQRSRVPPLLAFFTVALLTGALTTAAAQGLRNSRLMSAPPFAVNSGTLGAAGLILDQRHDTIITLIDSPALETGSRVVSIPGRPLIYQELPLDENGEVLKLPPVKFGQAASPLYQALRQDFALSARELLSRFDQGLLPFFAWLGPLIILLVSLSYIFNIGAWPLANIFLCALVFRGTLLFEVFLNSADVRGYLSGFVRGLVPAPYITPLVFAALAALFMLYCILMHFARERGRHGEI
jgi:hypothetical protein